MSKLVTFLAFLISFFILPLVGWSQTDKALKLFDEIRWANRADAKVLSERNGLSLSTAGVQGGLKGVFTDVYTGKISLENGQKVQVTLRKSFRTDNTPFYFISIGCLEGDVLKKWRNVIGMMGTPLGTKDGEFVLSCVDKNNKSFRCKYRFDATGFTSFAQ